MSVSIEFTWKTTTSLGIHTGLARAGSVDRAVRTRKNGAGRELPEIPGEAVKAVIREAAERMLRWQKENQDKEEPDRSVPTHPTLARLFAPQWVLPPANETNTSYLYRGATVDVSTGPEPTRMEQSATSINPATGAAANNTLRTIEVWKKGIRFKVNIRAEGGDWSDGSTDRKDLFFLLKAIACADTIGGGWGIGRGGIQLEDLTCKIDESEPVDLKGMLLGKTSRENVSAILGEPA